MSGPVLKQQYTRLLQVSRQAFAGFVEEICKYRETAHTVWMGGWPPSQKRASLGTKLQCNIHISGFSGLQ